jgi:small conductance mechanosensitive channel
VNSTAILASAGIIGLAVSIGAKDLIADILAGIAIVFEGVFRTGDIVEIGGYRGTVEEVGIRTTKVMSMQNVKVFRNSNISGVINMTQRYSFAQVSLDVSRTQPLEKVEAVFRDALPEIRSRIPGTVSDIELVGIDQLNAKGMVLLFQTKCREADRVRVERQLRRELVLVMEREGMTAVQAASSS